MNNLSGLKVALCQMKVVSGRPDLNTRYIIEEIAQAAAREVDIIAFPEMCATGYLVGDIFEDLWFMSDVERYLAEIIRSTQNGVAAILGTVRTYPGKKGEDGRPRKHNAALIAQNEELVGWTTKTLQPNYRFFNDDKHMYSLRKVVEEANVTRRNQGQNQIDFEDRLEPFAVKTRKGLVRVGVILCEDMWHLDYALNPTRILHQKGAEVIFNLSASPWTWQKNRKRHQVVRDLLKESPLPFCYVNNTGIQNVGKNIIVFDGSSTIYNSRGERIFEIPPYVEGPQDFVFGEDNPVLVEPEANDTAELYAAMRCATRSFTPRDAVVVVGMSGGIDSSVVAAHFTDVLGPDRVMGVNMPFLNSPETQEIARRVSVNLGIRYQVKPIGDVVAAISQACNVTPRSLAYENVQARARQEILAATAQKIGGVFSCNSNKVEVAFGYGTLYGDIAGFYAPLGDLVKREIRQIAQYLNQVRFAKIIIPEECINQLPTAELAPGQYDPFDYGDLNRRGYHDEMVRAFTEFRKNPEWFLELYLRGKLEKELKLDPGTLARLFPTAEGFVTDLEKSWVKLYGSYFKRIQCPPIPVFSKRAFGRDLEESIMSPHFTQGYRALKKYLLKTQGSKKKRITVYGGSFNPPGIHHRDIAARLTELFDRVIVIPCGPRQDKTSAFPLPEHRKAMMLLAFQKMPNKDRIELDFSDLQADTFTPTYDLNERYQMQFPNNELWHVIGGDLIEGGGEGNSEIQRTWKNGVEIWDSLNFVVITHPDYQIQPKDLPPKSECVEIATNMMGRSSLIRERLAERESLDGLVDPRVVQYIQENNLYPVT